MKAKVKCRLTSKIYDVFVKDKFPQTSVYYCDILLSTGFVSMHLTKSGKYYILNKDFPKIVT